MISCSLSGHLSRSSLLDFRPSGPINKPAATSDHASVGKAQNRETKARRAGQRKSMGGPYDREKRIKTTIDSRKTTACQETHVDIMRGKK